MGFKFYDSSSRSFFETWNTNCIEDVEYSGSVKLKNIVFEKEYVTIPTIATNNKQVIAHVIIQDANTDNHDTLKISPTHIEELTLTYVEEQQQPQLEVPLRRSTRKRRSMISNDYIMYL